MKASATSYCIVFIVIWGIGICNIKAKPSKNNIEQEERLIINNTDYTNVELNTQRVKEKLKEIVVKLKKDQTTELYDRDRLSSGRMIFLKNDVEYFIFHPYVEEQTRYSKKWYNKLSKILQAMSDTRRMENRANFEQSKKQQKLLLEVFVETAKNPKKLSKEEWQKLKDKRKAEERKKHSQR